MSEDNLPTIVNEQEQTPISTPAQARVDAVATLTMAAIQRASTLVLTPEESRALQADFPDEAFKSGAAGKERLLYIEHAFLRDRLNEVLGIGQWSLIPRSRWTEEFSTQKGQKGIRIYTEAMLLVRGCFVAEAIGDMDYYPGNAQTNYGDAVEGSKSAAFRRCSKEFGVGLQAWKKDWCEGWWQRRNNPRQPQPAKQDPSKQEPPKTPDWIKNLEHAATVGLSAYETAWKQLTKEQRLDVGLDHHSKLKAIAVESDDKKVRATEARAAIKKRLYTAAGHSSEALGVAWNELPPDEQALLKDEVNALDAVARKSDKETPMP